MTNLSIKLYGFITNLLQREEGQDLVEYAVLVGLIGVVAAVGIFAILDQTAWETFASEIEDCITFGGTGSCNLLGS